MSSSIKMKEYMGSELSGIFCVKLVAKNIVLRSPETHFMQMRFKPMFHLYTYPSGNIGNLWFSDIVREYRNGKLT